MRNGSAAVLEPNEARTHNTDGDFTAQYVNTRTGLTTGRFNSIEDIQHIREINLSRVAHGVYVTLHGTIEVVRIFESQRLPDEVHTAMVRLDSGTGAATYVQFNAKQYQKHFGDLVYGRFAGFSGTVVRPAPGAPEYIRLHSMLNGGSAVFAR